MINVLIANDLPIIGRRLRQALAETRDIVVAGEVNNGTEVLEEVAKRDFDVILLDISISGGRGLEILQQLHDGKPNLNILMMSNYCEEQYVVKVLTEGASGYLAKGNAPEELIPAIRQVASGKKFITSAFADKWILSTEPNLDVSQQQ